MSQHHPATIVANGIIGLPPPPPPKLKSNPGGSSPVITVVPVMDDWSAVPVVDRSSTGVATDAWLNSQNAVGLLLNQFDAASSIPDAAIAVSPDESAVHGSVFDHNPRAAIRPSKMSLALSWNENWISPLAPGAEWLTCWLPPCACVHRPVL